MFDARIMKKKYSIGQEDLPVPTGTIVQIIAVESETMEGRDGADFQVFTLVLAGWRVGYRLNNTKIDTLVAILGTHETDLWVGKKIMLALQPVTKFGKTEMDVVIAPMPVHDNIAITQPFPHMQKNVLGGHDIARSGSRTFPQQAPSFQLPGAVGSAGYNIQGAIPGQPQYPAYQQPQQPQLPPSPPALDVIGIETAIKIEIALAERGKTIDMVAKHIASIKPEKAQMLLMTSLHQWTVDVLENIRNYVTGFGPTREVSAAIRSQIREHYQPSALPEYSALTPPNPHAVQAPTQPAAVVPPVPATPMPTSAAPVAPEQVNVMTGEVMVYDAMKSGQPSAPVAGNSNDHPFW
jgi:hypothetical protein